MRKAALTLRPIRTGADYEAALKLVEPYFDDEPEPGSEAGAHFDALVTLIEAYEAKHVPIAPPTYEVFAGRRPLTLAMIQRLHAELGIPAEVLIQPTPKHAA